MEGFGGKEEKGKLCNFNIMPKQKKILKKNK